jgi:hypothetical protein
MKSSQHKIVDLFKYYNYDMKFTFIRLGLKKDKNLTML